MKKKFTICCVVVVTMLVIAAIVAALLKKSSEAEVVVHVVPPPSDAIGGVIEYNVTGASSVEEANRAIIRYIYGEDKYHRAIAEEEVQDIVLKIAASGCGQIKGEYSGGSPKNGALFWVNIICENSDVVPTIYIEDNQYYVDI